MWNVVQYPLPFLPDQWNSDIQDYGIGKGITVSLYLTPKKNHNCAFLIVTHLKPGNIKGYCHKM